IPAKPSTLAKLEALAQDIGLSFDGIATPPPGDAVSLKPKRIALWDRTGGSVPSGWTRYVLEKFEFPYTVILPDALEKTDLPQKFDVIIFVDDATTSPVQQLEKIL